MLIHLGNNEFIDMQKCVVILNLATVDGDTKRVILKQLSGCFYSEDGIEPGVPPRTAVLTTAGNWLGSSLSTEALAQRGEYQSFPHSVYLSPEIRRTRKRKSSSERSS